MKTLLLVVITLMVSLYGQSQPPKELHLNHLFIENGLQEGHVNKIIQDKQGYLWMGTFDGLVRFDGYISKKYVLPLEDPRTSPVLDICEDSTGGLWIADFYNGLYYYDHPNDLFIHYKHDPGNINSIAAGELRSITADAKGNLWLAIFNIKENIVIIDCFNIKSKHFRHFNFTEKSNYILNASYLSPIYIDTNGDIWSGSENGVQKYDYQKNAFDTYFASHDTASKKTIEVICADPFTKNMVWLGVKNTATGNYEGVWQCDINNKTTAIFRHHDNQPASLPSDTVLNIQTDSKKQLWITTTKGLSLYNFSSKEFVNFCPEDAKANSSIGHISKFEEDKDGNFWFTPSQGVDPDFNANAGLFAFDTKTKKFTHYKVNTAQSDGLNSNLVRNLYIDNSGCLWFNSSAAGVEWINNKKSRFTLHAAELARKSFYSADFLNSCAEAKDHTIWLATTGGLYHWFPLTDSFALIPTNNKAVSNPILSVIVDKEGLVWYSGDDGSTLTGLYCYNPFTKKNANYRPSKNNRTAAGGDYIHHIVEDHAGKLLLCTNGGLFAFDKKTKAFVLYTYNPAGNSSIRRTRHYSNLVWTAFEDKENALWLGTLGSLTRLDRATGKFTYYQDRLPRFQWIQNFYEDNEYHLWASSYNGGGLLMYDKRKDTMKRLSEKDGLLFDGAGSILDDGKGNLWVKSVRGISIINPKTLAIRNLTDDVLTESNHLINYSFKTAAGMFIFPSKYGFVTLHPNDFVPDSIAPVVHIESISFTKPDVKNKSEDSTIITYGKKSICLHYNENRITVRYVGLLYQNTSQIQYKYKLDGYDKNWITAGIERTITYTNLSPGTYTFHVTAANSDGVWSKDDAISIVISPPFWETWWFRTIVVLAIAGLIFFAVKSYLNRRLKAQQREFERQKAIETLRSKISMDIHDEISSGLTRISLLSQRVKSKYERSKEVEPEVIDKIARFSKEIISNLGEIIWAVNPRHDNLQSLLAYIRNYVFSFFESTSVEPCVDFPEDIKTIPVSPDIKHNVFLVIKEALNNILKHASATKVEIRFTYTNDFYIFTITDNGKGISNLNGRAFGNGLTNMKQRMEAINGSFAVHSEGKGTHLQLEGRFKVETEA